MKFRPILALLLLLGATSVQAQSNPGFIQGQILTAAELNAAFTTKLDYTLPLGTAAFVNVGQFAQVDNNLNDLQSASAARTNLGLGTFATQNFATPPVIGGGTPNAATFTTLTATGNTKTNVTGIMQCVYANPDGTLAGTGTFCGSGSPGVQTFNGRFGTVVLLGSDITGAGGLLTSQLASPPAIGNTMPNTGAFSTLTDSGITGSTQCLRVNSSGVLAGTGADCGSASNLSQFSTRAAAIAATIPGSITAVVLQGYYSLGDGGGGLYVHAGSGSAPNKFQSADGQWWILSLTGQPANLLQFGAKCDASTDDTTSIQSALNNANWVWAPNAQCNFTTLTITNPLRLTGQTAADGTAGESLLQSTSSGSGNKITVGNGSGQLNGVTLEHLTLSSPNATGGAMVFFNFTSDSGTSDVQMISLNSSAYGVLAYESNGIRFDHTRINLPLSACWRFYSGSGTTGRTDDMEINNSICLGDSLGAQTHLPIGIDLDGNVNTLTGTHLNIVDPGMGIYQHNSVGATDEGSFITVHDFEVDFAHTIGVKIDSGTGDYFANVYLQGSQTGPDVQVNYNASQPTGDISFVGGKIVNSEVSSNIVDNGTGLRISGVNVSGAGINATGTVPGIELGVHSADTTIVGNIIGTVGGLIGATQTYGVLIDSGAEQYVLNDNDLEGNVTGTVLDNSGASNVSFGMTTNNIGAVTPTSNGSSAPSTGFSINLGYTGSSPAAAANYSIFPSGTLATGTFLFPVHPYNTQAINIYSSQTVTALTLTAGSGDTIAPAVSTVVAGQTLRFIYNLATTTWVQFGGGSIGGGGSGVSSFNSRTGAVTLNSADVSAATGLLSTNNLSDLGSASTARTNLGLGTFATQNSATPPSIGGGTPAAGAFTTLSATSTLTTNVTGSTQCLQANSSGVVSGSGGACGGAGVTSFNTRTGAVTLSGSDVNTALGYTAAQAGGNLNITSLSSGADVSAATVTASGTSTANSLASRFAQTYNLKDFGAKCDGSTDDHTAIAAWLAKLAANVVLVAPSGVCLSSTSQSTPTSVIANAAMVSDGLGATTFEYTGAGTTSDFFTIGDGTHLISHFYQQGIGFLSNTVMTAGSAEHFKFVGRSIIRNVQWDSQDGNGNFFNGPWFDKIDEIFVDGCFARAQNDGVRVNGDTSLSGAKAGLFLSNCKIAQATVGVHMGGAFGGLVIAPTTDIILDGTGLLVDTALAGQGNREVFSYGTIDGSTIGPGVEINDAISAGLDVQISQWIASTTAGSQPCIDIKSAPSANISIDASHIYNCAGDGILDEDATAVVNIGSSTMIHTVGGYGVNCSSSTNRVFPGSEPYNITTGTWASNCNVENLNASNGFKKEANGLIHVWGTTTFMGAANTILAPVGGNPVAIPLAACPAAVLNSTMTAVPYGYANGAMQMTATVSASGLSAVNVSLVASGTVTSAQSVNYDFWCY